MSDRTGQNIGSLKDVAAFRRELDALKVALPCDETLATGADAPLARPIRAGKLTIGNRFCIHPMEGWDGTPDGKPSANTLRRWSLFGRSGAKLIWGGEAVAVQHDGRANPNQLLMTDANKASIGELREVLIAEHKLATGSTDGLVVGLQLTHSGRFSRPNRKDRIEPRVAFRHPILDRRVGIDSDAAVLSDGDVWRIIDAMISAAKVAQSLGYDFVDIKHCHGYLGHEFLAAHTRPGPYGGSFENRTRFLREIVQGVRSAAPGLEIGVRVSAFDWVPFKPDPVKSTPGKLGPGIPEAYELPYRWGFGINTNNPVEADLREPIEFLKLLRELGITLVNLSAGSPYYNPHIQRPALYPPSDGYQPPEDPLVGVQRQMDVVRQLKRQFPDLVLTGSAYTYLQDFLPNVAQAAVREGWVDIIGLGRMVLSYPELPLDTLRGTPMQHKRICRTFSDCTTAPRNGIISGCYPLDPHYKNSPEAAELKAVKAKTRAGEKAS